MDTLSRRTALKVIGGIPIAASVMSLVSCKKDSASSEGSEGIGPSMKLTVDTTPRLNIILHGMFAMNFDYKKTPNTLTVLAPKLYGHAYGLGDWKKELLLDEEDAVYTLKNAVATNPMAKQAVRQVPGALITWAASGITGVQPSGSNLSPYCTLNLEIPDEIWSLRQLNRTATDPSFFDGTGTTASANNLGAVLHLPLVHVLTYTGVKSNNPPILGDWTGAAGASYWNLHIHAEPSFSANNGHLTHGLEKLCQIFTPNPLDLKFKKGNPAVLGLVDTDWDTGHSTITVEEEEALEEIRAGIIADSKKTSHVHTCMKLITLNE